MKKQLLVIALGLALGTSSHTAQAQGSIIFSNYGETTYAPVSDLWMNPGPAPLVGSDYTAYLYYGFGTVTDRAQLVLLGNHVAFSDVTKGFFDGGIVPIPGYLSGPITFEVVAWPTDTSILGPVSPFDVPLAGHSGLFTLQSLPMGQAVEFGPGLEPFSIMIPEPSVTALIVLGAAAAMSRRRTRTARRSDRW